jgi:hypothetical protein
MATMGLNIIKTKKGKDSKSHGIKWVQDSLWLRMLWV